MTKDKTHIRWPTRFDYDIAMQNMRNTLLDSALRCGSIASTEAGIIHLERPDSLVCLYLIDDWIVRCFCKRDQLEPPEDIFDRYKSLSLFYEQNKSHVSALIPLKYVDKGIHVDFFDRDANNLVLIKTDVLPIIKMQYIHAESLGTFIASRFRDSQIMDLLCSAWLRMIREMEAVRMAHGDLDLTNVLVEQEHPFQQPLLKLVDYDNTWIPSFDYILPEYGHEQFQHPAFFNKSYMYNHKIDRFPALSIYISLKAIAMYPALYEQFGADELRLLFAPSDYRAEQSRLTGHIAQLREMNISELTPYIEELCASLHENRLPLSLDNIVPHSSNSIISAKVVSSDDSSGELPEESRFTLTPSSSVLPIKIFLCYAHEDAYFLEKLGKQLAPLQRQGLIDIWYDHDITAGTEWKQAIDEHINTADIILLLVSPDFIASDYCYSIEMKRALERHTAVRGSLDPITETRKSVLVLRRKGLNLLTNRCNRGDVKVIPVILRPIGWQETPLRTLQALPTGGIPLVDPHWHFFDYALHDVEKGIQRVINNIRGKYA